MTGIFSLFTIKKPESVIKCFISQTFCNKKGAYTVNLLLGGHWAKSVRRIGKSYIKTSSASLQSGHVRRMSKQKDARAIGICSMYEKVSTRCF